MRAILISAVLFSASCAAPRALTYEEVRAEQQREQREEEEDLRGARRPAWPAPKTCNEGCVYRAQECRWEAAHPVRTNRDKFGRIAPWRRAADERDRDASIDECERTKGECLALCSE